MGEHNYDQFIYGDAGKGMDPYSAESQEYYREMNERIAAMPDPYQEPSPRPRRRISRMPRFSEWYRLPDAKKEKQLPAGNFPAGGYMPDGLEVFEASRTTLADGTPVERLGIKNGDRYVTVVRYNGNNDDMVVVNGRGHATSTNSEYVNGIVLDELNAE